MYYLISPVHATCPVQLTGRKILLIFGKKLRIMKLCNIFHIPVPCLPLIKNSPLCNISSNTLSLCSSLNVDAQALSN